MKVGGGKQAGKLYVGVGGCGMCRVPSYCTETIGVIVTLMVSYWGKCVTPT